MNDIVGERGGHRRDADEKKVDIEVPLSMYQVYTWGGSGGVT